jgi:hypothetical protein
MIITILEALIALPKIGSLIMAICGQISQWWISKQKKDTLELLNEAMIATMRAQTDEDRYKAAEAWQLALSRSRISS